MESMKKLIALCVVTLSLTACQAHAKNMECTNWQAVDIQDADLNVAIHTPVKVQYLAQRMCENDVRSNKYYLEENKGIITTKRIISTWFDPRKENNLNSTKGFLKWLEFGLPQSLEIDISSVKPIKHKTNRTIGFYVYAKRKTSNHECIIANAGYRLRQPTNNHAQDPLDTFIEFFYCDENARDKDFTSLFRNLEISQ